MSNALRESRLWDKQLEGGLPDSRLQDLGKGQVFRARMWWERVFCTSCGCDGGLITAEFAAHVFYICDDCAHKYPGAHGLVEVPETVVKANRTA
jgi:hypothetical protein